MIRDMYQNPNKRNNIAPREAADIQSEVSDMETISVALKNKQAQKRFRERRARQRIELQSQVRALSEENRRLEAKITLLESMLRNANENLKQFLNIINSLVAGNAGNANRSTLNELTNYQLADTQLEQSLAIASTNVQPNHSQIGTDESIFAEFIDFIGCDGGQLDNFVDLPTGKDQ